MENIKGFISVIIPTFNRYDLVEGAIQSVIDQDFPSDRMELIVVDNAEPSDAARRLKEKYDPLPGVSVIHQPRRGVCAARNKGIDHARGEFVAFLDDDCRATESWLSIAKQRFDEYGEEVVVIGGKVEPLWVSEPPEWLERRSHDSLSLIDWSPETRPLKPSGEWLLGCNVVFRKDRILEEGGFPEHLGRNGPDLVLLSNDETELINRMRKKGYVALYEPAAVVKHHIFPERLTKAWMRRRAAWQAVSDFLSNPELSYKDGRATKRKFDGMLAVERQPTFWKRLTGKADEPARGRWFKSDTMATHTYRTVLAALAGYTLDEVADFDEEADEK